MSIFSYVKLGKKIFGKQKTTGETVNPFQRKTMRSDAKAKMGDIKVQLSKLKGGAKKLQTSVEDVKAAIKDKARVKKMGGGMMGRRMGYSQGSKGKIPTTPKEKSLAKLAPPRDRITFGDVVTGRTKGKRMQAKDGTGPEQFMRPRDMKDPVRDRVKQPLKIKKFMRPRDMKDPVRDRVKQPLKRKKP